MKKLAIRLLGVGLLLGMAAAPAAAQETGRANTLEDFQSADSNDGFLESNVDIWDLFHRAGSLGRATADEGFYRSQSRRISNQAAQLRERQRQILQQQAAEAENAPAAVPAPTGAATEATP